MSDTFVQRHHHQYPTIITAALSLQDDTARTVVDRQLSGLLAASVVPLRLVERGRLFGYCQTGV